MILRDRDAARQLCSATATSKQVERGSPVARHLDLDVALVDEHVDDLGRPPRDEERGIGPVVAQAQVGQVRRVGAIVDGRQVAARGRARARARKRG